MAQVNLGSPYRAKGAEARTFFATNGSPVYFTARKFSHGGVLDLPQGVTAVYLGPRANLPTVAPDSGEVSGTTVTLTVKEGEWEAVALPAGGYWVLTSTGGDLVVVGCSLGAVAAAGEGCGGGTDRPARAGPPGLGSPQGVGDGASRQARGVRGHGVAPVTRPGGLILPDQ